MTSAKVTISDKEHPEMGKLLKVEYDDGVCVYGSNKGLTITIPTTHEAVKRREERGKVEIIFNDEEIDILLQAIDKYEKG